MGTAFLLCCDEIPEKRLAKTFPLVPATKVISAVPPTGIVPRKMHQNAPNGTKALYVPVAQQQRIVQLRQMGKSVREIFRREKPSPDRQ
jgi:hypothetical protein